MTYSKSFYYDLTKLYQLTDTDILNGWEVEYKISFCIYRLNGLKNDPPNGDPAMQIWNPNGQLKAQHYFKNNRYQSPNDRTASSTWFSGDGILLKQEFCSNGVYHRNDPRLPAIIDYENGESKHQEFYYEGLPIPANLLDLSLEDIRDYDDDDIQFLEEVWTKHHKQAIGGGWGRRII